MGNLLRKNYKVESHVDYPFEADNLEFKPKPDSPVLWFSFIKFSNKKMDRVDLVFWPRKQKMRHRS